MPRYIVEIEKVTVKECVVTADNIDGYIAKMIAAIQAGATVKEALEEIGAVGLDEEKQAEALVKLQDYHLAVEETKYEHDLRLIGQEADKHTKLAKEQQLGNEVIQKIEETAEKKRDKLRKERARNTAAMSMQLIGSIAGYWQASGKNAEMVFNLQVAEALGNTYLAASKAFKDGGGWPGGVLPAALSITQGMTQVMSLKKAREDARAAASESVTAEYGANFVTDGLTNLTVGDNPGGQELVNVTPLSSPNMFGDSDATGGQNVTVNVSGNLLTKDYVEDELMEAISESVRRGSRI